MAERSTLPPPAMAPAGWYPAPDGRGDWYFDGTDWQYPPSPHDAALPDLPPSIAVGSVMLLVGGLIAGRVILESLLGLDLPVAAYLALSVVFGYGPSVAWLWFSLRRHGLDWSALGCRARPLDALWGPLCWLAAIAVQGALALLIVALDIPISENARGFGSAELDLAAKVALVFVVAVIAPVAEELIFRGAVLRTALGYLPAIVAVVAQGIAFGALHADPSFGAGNIGLIAVLSGVGCVFGAAAYWLRRVTASIIAHGIFNAVVVALLLSGIADRLTDDSPFGTLAAVAVALTTG